MQSGKEGSITNRCHIIRARFYDVNMGPYPPGAFSCYSHFAILSLQGKMEAYAEYQGDIL
jgi:hypothetical protein